MEMKVLGAVSTMARGANDRVEVGKMVTQECEVVTKGYSNGMGLWGAFEAGLGNRHWIGDRYVCCTVGDAIGAFSVKRCLGAHGLVGRMEGVKGVWDSIKRTRLYICGVIVAG